MDIHLSGADIREIERRGGEITAEAVRDVICRWHSLLNAGARELAWEFSEEEARALVDILARQTRADRLSHKDLWGMGMDRLARIVGMHSKGLGERCLKLDELAGMALKERVGALVSFAPGGGGWLR